MEKKKESMKIERFQDITGWQEAIIKTHQRSVWQEMTPKDRLRRSWSLRRRLKNIKEIHDKKIFPQP